MIVVTGAAGFIGSAFVWELNRAGIKDIIIADKLRSEDKWKNIAKRAYYDWVDRDELIEKLKNKEIKPTAIVHMGACSATTEKDADFLMKNNYEYSKKLWEVAAEEGISFVYASSAATYGGGEFGYDDNHSGITNLRPLNKYGYSKQIFDIWALKQEKKPKHWAGLKFFNVYGPNEYHKGRMASVVLHSFNQVKTANVVKLFKSHREDYEDGGQLRDFVYIKDVVKVIKFFMEGKGESGIYNLGTGEARSFYDLALNTMKFAGKSPNIEYIDMPVDIRDKYQYFTQANMEKLKKSGYNEAFYSLEDGVKDYVQNYLMNEDCYL